MALVTTDELAEALDRPTGADNTDLEQIVAAADSTVAYFLDPDKGPHDDHEADREAALAVAVQIYTSRKAPGGQVQAIDFQALVTPNLLGPGLSARIQGLIRPCRKYGGLVVG